MRSKDLHSVPQTYVRVLELDYTPTRTNMRSEDLQLHSSPQTSGKYKNCITHTVLRCSDMIKVLLLVLGLDYTPT